MDMDVIAIFAAAIYAADKGSDSHEEKAIKAWKEAKIAVSMRCQAIECTQVWVRDNCFGDGGYICKFCGSEDS